MSESYRATVIQSELYNMPILPAMSASECQSFTVDKCQLYSITTMRLLLPKMIAFPKNVIFSGLGFLSFEKLRTSNPLKIVASFIHQSSLSSKHTIEEIYPNLF